MCLFIYSYYETMAESQKILPKSWKCTPVHNYSIVDLSALAADWFTDNYFMSSEMSCKWPDKIHVLLLPVLWFLGETLYFLTSKSILCLPLKLSLSLSQTVVCQRSVPYWGLHFWFLLDMSNMSRFRYLSNFHRCCCASHLMESTQQLAVSAGARARQI